MQPLNQIHDSNSPMTLRANKSTSNDLEMSLP